VGEQGIFALDPELAGVSGVERVLRVDERRTAALELHLREGVERQRRLPRALGAEDLDDATPRIPAAAERQVEPDRPAGDDRHGLRDLALAEPHHSAFPVLLLDGAVCSVYGLPLLCDLATVPSL